jgi:RHS repeat-associated protein
MKYDLDGRRVQLRTTTGSTNTETNYLWDTTTRYGDVLVEIEKNGNIQARYVYGNACGSCSTNPVAELISQKRGAITNPREYYLLDGQGSVRGLTDGATGTLTQEYAYDTFGKLTSGDASKSAYLYTGQQYDAATELYSLRARYYSPQQGRFLSRDKWPVDYQNPMELNRYGYTANNPIRYSDPSGYGTGLFDNAIYNVKVFFTYLHPTVKLGLLSALALIDVVILIAGITMLNSPSPEPQPQPGSSGSGVGSGGGGLTPSPTPRDVFVKPSWVKDAGTFINWMRNIEKAHKDTGVIPTKEWLDAMLMQAKLLVQRGVNKPLLLSAKDAPLVSPGERFSHFASSQFSFFLLSISS